MCGMADRADRAGRSRPSWARGLKHRHRPGARRRDLESRPSWARGLKLSGRQYRRRRSKVAPFMGAWIETSSRRGVGPGRGRSRPSWARGLKLEAQDKGHVLPRVSRPSWARGLKHPYRGRPDTGLRSRPSWARGLKLDRAGVRVHQTLSRPSWARGLKPRGRRARPAPPRVAPFMGAWIETDSSALRTCTPSRRALHGRVD